MKKITTILAVLVTLLCNAQYYIVPVTSGNPNQINQEDKEYPPNGGLPNGWTTLMAGNKANAVWSIADTIPFNFMFNGAAVSTFKVSSSGVLTFDVNTVKVAPSHTNKSLPDNAIPDKSVCVWGMSAKGLDDAIVTKTFGTAPNRQYWVMFNNFSEATNFGNHYTYFSIVFEENSNRIYIVDQRTFGSITPTLTLGIQINSNEAYQLSSSPNYNPLAGNNASRVDNKYHTFVQGTQQTLDGFAKAININENLLLSRGPFAIGFNFENVGADTITQVDLKYQINANTPISASFTSLNISSFNSTVFPLNGSWTPPAKGNYTIKVWIENINGNSDLNNTNDTIYKQIKVYGQDHKRTPLIETFTSSTSPTSKTANSHVENFIANNSGLLTSLKYQMNSPGTGDPYFTTEGLGRKQLYAIQSVNTIQVDGKMQMYSQQLNQDSIDERLDDVAYLKLNASFWTSANKVFINVDVDPLETYSGTNYVLHVALFENKTTQNAKTSGETSFYNVMKKMIPNESGTLIGGLNKAGSSNYNFIYEFKGNFRLPTNANNAIDHSIEHSVEEFSDLGVLAWVQDNDTKEILQSQYAGYSIGINANVLEEQVFVYPNPAQNKLTIVLPQNSNATVQLINTNGQIIYTQNSLNPREIEVSTEDFPRGIYFIKLIIDNSVLMKKIILN